MKEGLEPNQCRIYEGRTRAYQTKKFMNKGLVPNQHRIHEGRPRA